MKTRPFPLLAMLLFAWGTAAQAQDALKGVALVIGQSKYEHITALPNPAADAREISKLLTDLGFDARSVTDRDAGKLSRDLERFVEDAEGADVAFLYYAGHGIEAGGENWLVPVDSNIESLGNARETLAPVSKVVAELQATVPVVVVLLDACRTNPFPPGAQLKLTPTGSGEPVSAGGLTVVRGAKALETEAPRMDNLGTIIGFAAEPGMPALDGAMGENSPYASALLRHLTAMKGAEFGQVMRMVTEEVYLDTKTRQRPWTNESLRRLLYFGVAPDEPTGDDGLITGERRQLLLTISELPIANRAQVEKVALKDGVPLDALFGVLRAMGEEEMPANPEELDKVLNAQATRLKKMLDERAALRADDPETQSLMASADKAINEGAIQTARSFLDKAVAMVEQTQGSVDAAEDLIRQKRIADASVYERRAQASSLVFDFASAASDYARAFDLVEKWDERLRWNYKNLQAEALGALGNARADRKALDEAVAAYEEVLDLIPRNERGRDWAITRNNLALIYQSIGEQETDNEHLDMAVNLLRDSLAIFEEAKDETNWSAAQNNIGNLLVEIGARGGDLKPFVEAAAAHRAALAKRPRSTMPYEWASSNHNLGVALQSIGDRTGGGQAYNDAEQSYRTALEEWTREKSPAEWAMALNNLGNTLIAQGNERNDVALYDEAASIFRQALEVRIRENFPIAWGATQLNLGTALYYAAKYETGSQRLQEAAQAYGNALDVFPRDRVPLDWASAKNNYGSILQTLGQRNFNPAQIEQSIVEFSGAREVYARDKFPLDWAMTYYNSGNSLQLLAVFTSNPSRYADAIDAYKEALREYLRDRVPEQWALAQSNIGKSHLALARTENASENLKAAIAAQRLALEVLTIDNAAIDWANANDGLGMALLNLGSMEMTSAYSEEAEMAFQNVPKVFTREKQPLQWAFAQNNLGDVYWNRGVLSRNKALLEQSLTFFDAAKEGLQLAGNLMMAPLLDQKIKVVQQQLAAL